MDFSQDELFEAIDRLVNGLLERAGVVKPPVNALEIAESHLGVPVEIVEPVEEDERGRPRPRSRPAHSGIFLTPDMTEEQQQKAAADGIARALLPDILRKLNVLSGTESKQFSAHVRGAAAARLLVPNKLFRAALKECGHDLLALNRLFSTAAMEMIALRFLDLDEPCVIAIVDDGIVAVRRSNRFAATKQLERAERTCLDQIMKLDLPERVRIGEWTVQGWPVPGRPIRRIILRAVPDDI
jgi:predicted transcriptional regulator